MRFRVTVDGSSDQALDLDRHQWLRLLHALGPPPARVSSQQGAWTAVVVVDATSQDDACARARNVVLTAAEAVGLGEWRVERCTAEPDSDGPVKVVPLRPVKAVEPGVIAQGALSVNGDSRGWRGPLRLLRLLFVPSESVKRTLAHLDGRPRASGTMTFTVPHVNGGLLYPPGPARAAAQALHRRAFDRELRRRGYIPAGANSRGTTYRRPPPRPTAPDT